MFWFLCIVVFPKISIFAWFIRYNAKLYPSQGYDPTYGPGRIPTVKLNCPGKAWEKQDTEILLHSSYSFGPWLSTSDMGWDLASTQPWKNVKNRKDVFHIFFMVADLLIAI